jgi:prevent-host-death family protein
MSERLSIARAKARFAEAVRRAEGGDMLILTRHGRPVARLAPLGPDPTAVPAGPGDVHPEEIREAGSGYESAGAGAAAPLSAGRTEQRREALERVLAGSVWPRVPEDQLGHAPDRSERDEILGHGEEGV